MGSVENISPSWLGPFFKHSTVAIASDRGMGYIAFCALSGNPLAFQAWGTLFCKVWFLAKSRLIS